MTELIQKNSNKIQHLKRLNAEASAKFKQGKFAAAIKLYQASLKYNPDQANIHFNLGLSHTKLKNIPEAVVSYKKSIELKPNYAKAYKNLGKLLKDDHLFEEALVCYDAAIKYQPDYAEAHNHRGNLLLLMKRFSEAEKSFKKAIELQPDFAAAYNNLGRLYKDLMRYEDAIHCYDTAILFRPDYVSAYMNKSLLCLLMGDFEQGWRLFEWRCKTKLKRPTLSDTPLWLGKEPIKNKHILIWSEQGFGDTIQYCRYLILMEQAGALIHLKVQKSLQSLVETLPCQLQTITTFSNSLPDVDYHCPMMSLPLALGTTNLDKIPAPLNYLRATPEKKAIWSERIDKCNGRPQIGLAWSGSPTHNNDHNRSLSLNQLSDILSLPIDFHVIQKDIRSDDDQIAKNITNLHIHSEHLYDFSETAALIEHMDLVISVDTSIAHLTGAINCPIWLLLPYIPDHRWLLNRSDSPWYPSARLFRQSDTGNWKNVIDQITNALRQTFSLD